MDGEDGEDRRNSPRTREGGRDCVAERGRKGLCATHTHTHYRDKPPLSAIAQASVSQHLPSLPSRPYLHETTRPYHTTPSNGSLASVISNGPSGARRSREVGDTLRETDSRHCWIIQLRTHHISSLLACSVTVLDLIADWVILSHWHLDPLLLQPGLRLRGMRCRIAACGKGSGMSAAR